jgi:hypothetical protein
MTEEPRLALLTLAEYQETLERLRRLERLCVRAADALEEEFGPGIKYPDREPWKLITELRKAAE